MTPGKCSAADCEGPVHGNGLCKRHWSAEYRRRPEVLERERLRMARSRAADPEAGRKACRDWRARNPEAFAASHRRWQEANAEKQRAVWAAKRARRLAHETGTRIGKVDFTSILREHGMVCHICTGTIDGAADLHFDHVIPLALGGPHVTDNIRPAHAGCNMRKGATILAAPHVEHGLATQAAG